jgi:hypothetical protein
MFKRATLILVVALSAAVLSSSRADLVFEQTALELHPAVGDEKAVGHFKYQNKGDKTIAIKSVTTSCGCTAASAKQSAEPGEKGEVTATFNVGERNGTQQKAITVTTDDPVHPVTTLNLKVVIPQVLDVQPAFVMWQANEANKPKTIIAKAGKDISVKNLEVQSSSPDFTATVEKSNQSWWDWVKAFFVSPSAPGQFKINVEPKQTQRSVATTLTIKPVLSDGKTKIFYATARVMPQMPVAGQPAVTPGTTPAAPPMADATNQSKIDACGLLTSKEIESVQGEPIKETKGSGKMMPDFAISQCYFAVTTASNSISLGVTQKGGGSIAKDPKQFWKEVFHKDDEKADDKDKEKSKDEDKDKGKERGEEHEKSVPPKKIDGVGDEAFWTGNRVGGTLYVLKGNEFIRVSVGGAGDEASKIDKSKKLAQMVLKRL